MKKIVILIVGVSCSVAFAADNLLVQRSLQEIDLARQQAQMIFDSSTSLQDKERARYVTDRLQNAQDLLRQSLSSGGGNPPPYSPRPPSYPSPGPAPDGRVEIYRSDTCSSSFVAAVDEATDCDRLATAGSAWGVKVNGQCMDIADTTAVLACKNLKALAQSEAISFYHSDNCSSDLVAAATRNSICSDFDANKSIWGVKVEGRCIDISDTSLGKVCPAMKSAGSIRAVKIYHNDQCASSLVAAVEYDTRCEDLAGLASAWAVEINGQCQDISDIDIVTACNRFK